MIPGEVRVFDEPVELNDGLERQSMIVVNDGDRPIQVGSHLHFPDSNPALSFDRDQAVGFRLDVPAGTSVRFEPGVSRTVELVALAGRRHVAGLQLRTEAELPTHGREPKKIVPFGTPGTEVETPTRAAAGRARVSEEPARREGDDEASARPGEQEDS